jgi:hypothetical protein
LPEKRNLVFTEIRFNNYRDIKQSDDTVKISLSPTPTLRIERSTKII